MCNLGESQGMHNAGRESDEEQERVRNGIDIARLRDRLGPAQLCHRIGGARPRGRVQRPLRVGLGVANMQYVARLQYVQTAVDAQIESLAASKQPMRHKLVSFNDVDVDGTGQHEVMTGDKLNDLKKQSGRVQRETV